MAIVHRVGGSPLTNQQVDDNFDYAVAQAAAASAAAAAALQPASNLSDVASAVTSRSNLGLGSASVESAAAFATAAQGAKADSAVQPTVAVFAAVYHSASGSFTETIPDNVTAYTLVVFGATSGTLTMPATAVDGQIIEVSCTGAIVSITVSPNTGQSIVNAPTSMAAGSGFSYRYKGATSTWYRRY